MNKVIIATLIFAVVAGTLALVAFGFIGAQSAQAAERPGSNKAPYCIEYTWLLTADGRFTSQCTRWSVTPSN